MIYLTEEKLFDIFQKYSKLHPVIYNLKHRGRCLHPFYIKLLPEVFIQYKSKPSYMFKSREVYGNDATKENKSWLKSFGWR